MFRPTLRPSSSSSSISALTLTRGDTNFNRSSAIVATRGYHTTQHQWQQRQQQQQQQQQRLLAHEWIVDGKITSSRGEQQQGSKEREVIVFLHGLLGNAKNLRTPAKIFTRRLPQYDALLLDVRGHGGSASSSSLTSQQETSNNNNNNNNNTDITFARPHNIQSCAQDVINTLSHLGLHGHDNSPSVICGHSLGGRIALQYTHSLLHYAAVNTVDDETIVPSCSSLILPPKQTWILDSVPGVADPSVSKVLSAISSLSTMMTLSSSSSSFPSPSPSGSIPTKIKSQITTQLVETYGLDIPIATWIVSSLRGIIDHKQEEGQHSIRPIWAFDIDIAMELVQNFTEQDVVGMIRQVVVESSSSFSTSSAIAKNDDDDNNDDHDDAIVVQRRHRSHGVVQLVMAGKNESWTEDIISELQTIVQSSSFHKIPSLSSSSFKMHTLDKAGHWVHVDDLDGLMKLMVDELS